MTKLHLLTAILLITSCSNNSRLNNSLKNKDAAKDAIEQTNTNPKLPINNKDEADDTRTLGPACHPNQAFNLEKIINANQNINNDLQSYKDNISELLKEFSDNNAETYVDFALLYKNSPEKVDAIQAKVLVLKGKYKRFKQQFTLSRFHCDQIITQHLSDLESKNCSLGEKSSQEIFEVQCNLYNETNAFNQLTKKLKRALSENYFTFVPSYFRDEIEFTEVDQSLSTDYASEEGEVNQFEPLINEPICKTYQIAINNIKDITLEANEHIDYLSKLQRDFKKTKDSKKAQSLSSDYSNYQNSLSGHRDSLIEACNTLAESTSSSEFTSAQCFSEIDEKDFQETIRETCRYSHESISTLHNDINNILAQTIKGFGVKPERTPVRTDVSPQNPEEVKRENKERKEKTQASLNKRDHLAKYGLITRKIERYQVLMTEMPKVSKKNEKPYLDKLSEMKETLEVIEDSCAFIAPEFKLDNHDDYCKYNDVYRKNYESYLSMSKYSNFNGNSSKYSGRLRAISSDEESKIADLLFYYNSLIEENPTQLDEAKNDYIKLEKSYFPIVDEAKSWCKSKTLANSIFKIQNSGDNHFDALCSYLRTSNEQKKIADHRKNIKSELSSQ